MTPRAAEPVDQALARLVRINPVAAVAFFFGGSLFALGALFAQLGVHPGDGQHHLPGRGRLLQPRRLRVDPAGRQRRPGRAPHGHGRSRCAGGATSRTGATG